MAVKLIVNGYFRSGTTIIWKILKESNPNHIVFYDPCNHYLIREVEKSVRYGLKNNRIHKMVLWEEYLDNYDFFQTIKSQHPNIGAHVPKNYNDIKLYFLQFNLLNKNIILQTHRWHLFLGDISKDFDVPIIQIIRNPVDVYDSIMRVTFKDAPLVVKIIRYIFKPIFENKAFDIYYWHKHYSELFPKISRGRFYSSFVNMFIPFEKFFAVWILSNYNAIKSLNKESLIVFEKMLIDPDKYLKIFNKHGCEFKYDGLLKSKDQIKSNEKYDSKQLLLLSEKLKLKSEFDYILSQISM